MTVRPFRQVDVFATSAFTGNPLAVIHDAEGLADEQLAAIARWTNLSETTFLLPPTDPAADYRVRIFTGTGELPFAGHPTLGSCHAWLEAGGRPRGEHIVQQCGVGLVPVRRDADRLAFAAPPLLKSGPVDPALGFRVVGALGCDPGRVVGLSWIDNGPGWIGVLLRSGREVLDLRPDPARMAGLKVAIAGPTEPGTGHDLEVRAFYCPDDAVLEDPVTGSANAGLALWLIDAGILPSHYVARQGTCVGADGRVRVERVGDATWIGGAVRTVVSGTIGA
ncbi:MAG TPA: PhzF family phenazine biosynthesis protein [Propionibacteriaceae bacterium]|nr:PhzF family phenazine biosynthesis protein [Propionibacteriaceae bacterium]